MGKNSYMISGMRFVKTTFVTPKYPGELFPEPQNTSVVAFPFLLTPSPRGLAKVPHEINRVLKIIVFSIRTILLFYKHRPDIVHVHSPMFFLIALIAKLLGKRCYITYHGNEHERVYKNRFIGKLFNFVFFKTFSLSSKISDYGLLYPSYAKNYISIDNAVDGSIFSDRGAKRAKIILAVGRLEKQKDYPTLLRSFSIFLKTRPDYELHIVGSGQGEQSLLFLARELKIIDSVKFLGQIDQDHLPALYNKADIFVLCSLWEGFPKVLLEAMSSGCKVVSTRVDSIPRILGPSYPFLVDPSNADDLAFKLLSIIDEGDEFRSSYSEVLKKFSWDHVKASMEAEYNSHV
jgi:glycosyltransferase involved in cell wall biosynthesis